MRSAEQRTAFTRMVAMMRSDSTGTADVAAEDLQVVLLGAEQTGGNRAK